MKVLTTATALKVLGENYKFETKLYYTGNIIQGVLNGNIIIQGSGDPTLGSSRIPGNLSLTDFISLIITKIKEAGVTKINGKIIQDLFAFNKNAIPDGWIWTDIGNYYGAGCFGLNINENSFNIYFKPGKKLGDSTSIIRTEPSYPNLRIDNKVLTGPVGSGDNAWVFGAPYSNFRLISGSIPAGVNEFSIKASIPDPAYLLVFMVYSELIKNGIQVMEEPTTSDLLKKTDMVFNQPKSLLYNYQSPPLKDIVYYTNLNSLNLYAEGLYNSLEKKLTNCPNEVITDYWKSKGIITEGNFIYDGSGLSPQTGIKPSFLTLILFETSKDSSFNAFFNSLPVAGESGTLSRFCKGTKAEKKIFAKSGSMEKVLGYSGFVKSKSGETYSFSLLINNYTGKPTQTIQRVEKIMIMLTEL
jgi:D-alanyl-D-alanine carboxypeptidase/D-alanyl-D-alanine-endopeptidase (penicillin-binding protein 4)